MLKAYTFLGLNYKVEYCMCFNLVMINKSWKGNTINFFIPKIKCKQHATNPVVSWCFKIVMHNSFKIECTSKTNLQKMLLKKKMSRDSTWAPYEQAKIVLQTFLIFAEIIDCKVQKLGVCVVNENLDINFLSSYNGFHIF